MDTTYSAFKEKKKSSKKWELTTSSIKLAYEGDVPKTTLFCHFTG